MVCRLERDVEEGFMERKRVERELRGRIEWRWSNMQFVACSLSHAGCVACTQHSAVFGHWIGV